MTTPRTPEEAFADHGQTVGGEDLEGIISDCSDDAILIVQNQVYRGTDGVRQVFIQLPNDVPQAKWELETTFADDVLHLGWKPTGGARTVENGVDTFIFTDAMIRVQTVVYTVQPA